MERTLDINVGNNPYIGRHILMSICRPASKGGGAGGVRVFYVSPTANASKGVR